MADDVSAPRSLPAKSISNLFKNRQITESWTSLLWFDEKKCIKKILLVCLLADDVSAPRSLPAKSISENFPYRGFLAVLVLNMIWNTAWDREECWLAEVCPDVRRLLPDVMSFKTSSTEVTTLSVSPTTWTCCLPSSRTRSLDLPDNKSKTFPLKIKNKRN